MKENKINTESDTVEINIVLISKIYESFEALEETLGNLKLKEPLFITYVAKKAFANQVYNCIKNNKLYKNKFKN